MADESEGPRPERLSSDSNDPRMPSRLRAGIGRTLAIIEGDRPYTVLRVAGRKTFAGVQLFSIQTIRRSDRIPTTWINLSPEEARQVKALLDAWLEG